MACKIWPYGGLIDRKHIEAVHRLLRCDCSHFLTPTDFTAFQRSVIGVGPDSYADLGWLLTYLGSEYRLIGQDAAEYDFRDFRWAKLERLRRGARSSTSMARDEALLEYKVGGETAAPSAAPSPRLDAVDINSTFAQPAVVTKSLTFLPSSGLDLRAEESIEAVDLAQTDQPWLGLAEPESDSQLQSLDWSWLLGESGYPGYQTGDPNIFWSQLQHN